MVSIWSIQFGLIFSLWIFSLFKFSNNFSFNYYFCLSDRDKEKRLVERKEIKEGLKKELKEKCNKRNKLNKLLIFCRLLFLVSFLNTYFISLLDWLFQFPSSVHSPSSFSQFPYQISLPYSFSNFLTNLSTQLLCSLLPHYLYFISLLCLPFFTSHFFLFFYLLVVFPPSSFLLIRFCCSLFAFHCPPTHCFSLFCIFWHFLLLFVSYAFLVLFWRIHHIILFFSFSFSFIVHPSINRQNMSFSAQYTLFMPCLPASAIFCSVFV